MFNNIPLGSIDEFARALAGNWKKFPLFGWEHSSDENSSDWAIIYTHNRDSDALAVSNAEIIAEILGEPRYAADVRSESHGHWAVGWVDGFAVRVYRDGEITPVVKELLCIARRLDEYPILDEAHWSQKQVEMGEET